MWEKIFTIERLIFWAGLGQIGLVFGSTYVPIALGWRKELAKLRPLTRQVFWTYAGYILCTNLCFGLVSTFGTKWLIDRTPLAALVTTFIAIYWLSRVLIQFFYFDRSDAPKGMIFTLGEIALVTLFIFLTLIYGYVAIFNIRGAAW
jgi:hypothetical protein